MTDSVNKLAQKVELIVFDFDGVFTDNSVYVDQNGVESVRCSRSDGLGLRRLDEINIQYCIVSTETNPIVTVRAQKLNIPVSQGHDDKLSVVREIINTKNIKITNNELHNNSHGLACNIPNSTINNNLIYNNNLIQVLLLKYQNLYFLLIKILYH